MPPVAKVYHITNTGESACSDKVDYKFSYTELLMAAAIRC